MNKGILMIFCCLLQATEHHVRVLPGDSFNMILKKSHIAPYSINKINAQASELRPLATLKPDDNIKLFVDEDSKKLISATIQTKMRQYVLNKENNQYQMHILLPQHDVQILNASTYDITENLDKLRIQRLCHMLFPDKTGSIEAAIKDHHIISIKLLTQDETMYAFLHHDNHSFPYYYDIYGQTLMSALDRTPTHYKRVSSPFNPKRLHPVSKKVMPHKGVDLAAPVNTPVWAAANGKVLHKSSDTGYGNMLIIEHENGLQTYYAHLNKFHNNIKPGQFVKAFETIGYVGSTGVSTGYHLHFETRLEGVPYDPLTLTINKTNNKIKEILVPFYYF